MKLKIKLPLLLLPLVTIPLLIVGIITHKQLHDVADNRSLAQVDTLLDQVALQVEDLVGNARSNMHLFSKYPLIEQYFLADTEEERYLVLYRPVQRQLFSIQEAYPAYYELRIVLPDGFEDLRIVNRHIPNQTEEEQHSSFYQEIKQASGSVVARFDINPDNNQLACFVTERITLRNAAFDDPTTAAKLRGYLSMTIDVAPLLRQLELNPLGSSGGLFITNNEGAIVYAPEHLKWLESEDLSALSLGNKIPSSVVELAAGAFHIRSKTLHNNLWMYALLSEDDMMSAGRSLSKTIALITVMAILISLLLLLCVLKSQVLGPVSRLRQGIARLSEGDELYQVSVESNDELGILGTEFNRMSLELKKSNDQIRNMAYSDFLTELPNRFMFQKLLKQSMNTALRENSQLGVLFIDLDNFKNINDTLGHHSGDRLLKDVANRLQKNLRGEDIARHLGLESLDYNLARLGGDEFTVLVRESTSVIGIGKVAERMVEAIEMPFVIDGKEHHVSASIGVAVFPGDGENSEDLIKHADLAMYQAKRQGKGRFEFYSKKISDLVMQRTQLEQRLRIALENENFELFYQPIIDSQTQKVSSLEALIRWNDDELGDVSPDYFIPVAEEMGLINDIGAWVLAEACQQLRKWQASGIAGLKVAVNVSVKQLEKADFSDQVFNNLKKYDVPAESLYLELTESAVIQGEAGVLETLRKLQKIGIRIALDDFGTGYSSLSYLRHLPIDILKIDRSFIQDLGQQNNNVILSAIITMAHALSLEVVAEGVETQCQFAFLKKEHCNLLQGYLFHRPEPVDKIDKMLAANMLQSDPCFG